MAIKVWLNRILLLEQETYLVSFSKVFLFLCTHLVLLSIFYYILFVTAHWRGIDSHLLRIGVPSVISWLFFFGPPGKELFERDLFKLTLVYSYILLAIHIFINFKSLVKQVLNNGN